MSVNFNDIYISDLISEESLEHHGILGQKWGIRRFQNKDGSLTNEGRVRYGASDVLKNKKPEQGIDEERHKSDKSQFYLWMTMTALDTGLTVLNPANAPYLAQDIARGAMAANGHLNKKKYDKEKEMEEIDKKTGFHIKADKEMSEKEDLKRVNPLVYNFDTATKNNCMLCTTTYDLRRRGYDVEANIARYGYDYVDVKKWYPNAQINSVMAYSEKKNGKKYGDIKATIPKLTAEIEKQGEGARGNIMVQWRNGSGGHSMIYEVKDGKMRILDGQVNKIYEKPEKILKKCSPTIYYARLDNQKVDWEAMKEVAI